jgi:hypothetical protein
VESKQGRGQAKKKVLKREMERKNKKETHTKITHHRQAAVYDSNKFCRERSAGWDGDKLSLCCPLREGNRAHCIRA